MAPPKKPNPYQFNPTISYEPDNTPPNWRPVPDPTPLTTQQLMRELGALKEIMQTRMDGYDRAIALLQAFADRQPTVGELAEKLAASDMKAAETDKRYGAEFIKLSTIAVMMTDQQALALAATKESVSVAMSASEKAIVKAEMAAEKRFESLNEFRQQLADQQATFARSDLVNQRADALEKKIDEVARLGEARATDSRDRLTAIEGRGQAYSQGFAWIISIVGIVAGAAGAFMAVLFKAG